MSFAAYRKPTEDSWYHQDDSESVLWEQTLRLFSLGQGDQTRAVPNVGSNVFYLPPTETSARTIAFKADVEPVATSSARDLVRELRALTGLTWERMGTLLNVSSRMIHLWQNGETISSKNHAHLAEVVAVMKYINRGDSMKNRELLLLASPDGATWSEGLRRGEYSRVREAIGKGGEQVLPRPPFGADALRHTGPDTLEDLVDEAVNGREFGIDPIARRPGKRLAKAKPRNR